MKTTLSQVLILIFIFGLFPINFSNAKGAATRLKGRILLQVESKGEAWYVNPENEKRYYLGRPADAFQVMRELGLGISNKDFDLFNGKAPNRLSGKILLKVEDGGKAYYVNPVDLKLHYLGMPNDAFQIMRKLGLGISNKDLYDITPIENASTELGKINDSVESAYSYIVQVDCDNSLGSGTIIEPGKILTNFHVIDGSINCKIGFTTNTNKAPEIWSDGVIKLVDKVNDRAIIEVNNKLSQKTLSIPDNTEPFWALG